MNLCAIVACYVVLTFLLPGVNTALDPTEKLKKLGYSILDEDDKSTGR